MENTNNTMGGFFGRLPFGMDGIREKWSRMTEEEKKAFVEEKVNHINEKMQACDEMKNKWEKFSVEEFDKRSSEWQSKTAEEKEAFVKEKKEKLEKNFSHFACHAMHFGWR